MTLSNNFQDLVRLIQKNNTSVNDVTLNQRYVSDDNDAIEISDAFLRQQEQQKQDEQQEDNKNNGRPNSNPSYKVERLTFEKLDNLSVTGWKALIDSFLIHNKTSLKHIIVSSCSNIPIGILFELFDSVGHCNSLLGLTLNNSISNCSDNVIYDQSIFIGQRLGNVLRHNTTLQELYLVNDTFNDQIVSALMDGLKSNRILTTLSLTGPISNIGACILADCLQESSLRSSLQNLSLDCKSVSDSGAVALANTVRYMSGLKILLFHFRCKGKLDSVISTSLAQFLYYNSTVTKIKLKAVIVTNVGAQIFAKAIRYHPTLKNLSIRFNDVTDDGIHEFITAMKYNEKLSILFLFGVTVSDKLTHWLLNSDEYNDHFLHYCDTLKSLYCQVPIPITTNDRLLSSSISEQYHCRSAHRKGSLRRSDILHLWLLPEWVPLTAPMTQECDPYPIH